MKHGADDVIKNISYMVSLETCVYIIEFISEKLSLSVAYKKHIYNQKTPLKSEDTSVFDQTELAGAKEGSSPWSETTLMLFRPQHTYDSEFQVMNLKKKDFHVKLVNLYSPNDTALSLNALPLPCCWRLQQSFTELGI